MLLLIQTMNERAAGANSSQNDSPLVVYGFRF